MQLINLNIWEIQADWYCIPTNGIVKADGRAVMGAGLALDAVKRFPGIDKVLGELLKLQGNWVHYLGKYDGYGLISFPTKHHWKHPSDLDLIRQSCDRLEVKRELYSDHAGRSLQAALPKVGCGLGGLDWEKEVKPVLEEYFGDNDDFIVAV